jgi:hypothetical protein
MCSYYPSVAFPQKSHHEKSNTVWCWIFCIEDGFEIEMQQSGGLLLMPGIATLVVTGTI